MAKAKKKKGGKRPTARRRSVGAAKLNAQSPLVMIGALAAGYLLADTINGQLDKVVPATVDGKIVGAGEAGIGAALVFMKLGKKKTIIEVAAGGVLAGAGLKRLLREFGVINGIGGYQALPVIARSRAGLNGYGKVPVLGGYATNPAASRMNGVFNGYAVPKSVSSQVMGSAANGSGYSYASGYMD